MGESLHSLSFAIQGLYNETGKVETTNLKIDFGSTELTNHVQAILDADPSMKEYFNKAGRQGYWDIKRHRKTIQNYLGNMHLQETQETLLKALMLKLLV